MAALAALGCFVFVTLVTLLIGSAALERSSVQSTLGQLGHYAEAGTSPLRRRRVALGRLLGAGAPWARHLGRAVTSEASSEKIRRRLVAAGRGRPEALDAFLALRVLAVALVPVWAVVGTAVFGGAHRLWWAAFAGIAVASVLGPDAALNRAAGQRQHAVRASLPEVLDLLTISVEAGYGLEQALERVATDLEGPLSDEMRRVHGEVRAGASWAAAMRGLSERVDLPELKRFTLAITQADALGVPIAPMLRAQSDEIRIRRRQLAQEGAQKAPVKMLLPMVFCIFPSLFVVVIGPAIINMRQGLG